MNPLNYLMEWLFNLPYEIANLWTWLSTPLPYINIAPLVLFSATGITAIVGLLVLRLVVGG